MNAKLKPCNEVLALHTWSATEQSLRSHLDRPLRRGGRGRQKPRSWAANHWAPKCA